MAGIALLPVLTKTLGAYGYGLWVQATATFSILFPIISLGLPEAMTRYFPAKKIDEIRDDFYSSITLIVIIAITVSLLIYLYPYPLANAIFDGEVWVVRITAVILFVRSLDHVLLLVFRAFREMKKYATLNILTKYGEIGLAIFLVLSGYGLWGALLAIVIVRTSMLFVLSYLVGKKIFLRLPTFSSTKKYLQFGLPMIPKAISRWLINTSDRYIIGFFLGATFVGYYSPGYSLGILVPLAIGSVVTFVLPPTLSSHYEKGNIKMINTLFNLSLKIFFIISIPYLIGAIVLGRPILELITTEEIAREGHIIVVFSGLAGIFSLLRKIFSMILFIIEKTKLKIYIFGLPALINLIGNIILVPRIGIIGAGITTVLSYIISLVLAAYWALKLKDFNLRLGELKPSLVKIIFSSIIMGIVIYYLYHFIMVHYLILVVLGILFYFLIVYLIGGIEEKEVLFLKNTLSK